MKVKPLPYRWDCFSYQYPTTGQTELVQVRDFTVSWYQSDAAIFWSGLMLAYLFGMATIPVVRQVILDLKRKDGDA